jgi:hypothetical protein
MKWTKGMPIFNHEGAEFLYDENNDMMFSIHYWDFQKKHKVYFSRFKQEPIAFDTREQAKAYCETMARIVYG